MESAGDAVLIAPPLLLLLNRFRVFVLRPVDWGVAFPRAFACGTWRGCCIFHLGALEVLL